MADTKSFDILANVDLVEVKNAVEQSNKEISKRYDFKGSLSNIELLTKENELVMTTEDESKLEAMKDIFSSKLIARKLSLKAFVYEKSQAAAGQTIKVIVKIQKGVPQDKAKEIVKYVKDLGLKKIQVAIQQDSLRVSAPKIDDLQDVMQKLKEKDFGIYIDFGNYR